MHFLALWLASPTHQDCEWDLDNFVREVAGFLQLMAFALPSEKENAALADLSDLSDFVALLEDEDALGACLATLATHFMTCMLHLPLVSFY